MNKENVIYTCNGILLILQWEGNPAIYNSMDKPWEHDEKKKKHDEKWNKPIIEGLHDFNNMRYLK